MKNKNYLRLFFHLIMNAFLLHLFMSNVHAQNTFPSTGSAGIGTTSPDASAKLEIKSTTRGILGPRMSRAQRNAIPSPATGLMIYQTDNTSGFYYYTGSAWKAITPRAAWSLTGNAGTNPSTHFLGTTDKTSLVFKVNNLKAGLIDYSTFDSGTRSTSFGLIALYSNISGIDNTANGYGALYSNQSGSKNSALGKYSLFNNNANDNTAIGFNTMFFNTTGINNTATGSIALQNNTTGQQNTANGFASLYSNNSGSYNTATGTAALHYNAANYNTATGAYALYLNTTGSYNVAQGNEALYQNTTGSNNTANGFGALHLNNNGSSNTATGFSALYNNTSGAGNTANGFNALYKNEGGSSNTATGLGALFSNSYGNKNTAVGNNAVGTQSYGSNNTGVGYNAMYGTTDGGPGNYENSTGIGSYALFNIRAGGGSYQGNDNTAVGYSSLYNLTDGMGNTAVGVNSLYTATRGGNNTAIGNYADVNNKSMSNATAIGSGAIATASNQVMLGNTLVTSVKAAGNVVIYSDGRFKKNLKENVPGLAFINQLKPVTYNYDIHGLNKLIAPSDPSHKSGQNNEFQKRNEAVIALKEKILYTGFVAQEVETAAKKAGYDFSGVYKPQNDKDAYGLSYADFVVPLVKAVQELSKMNDDKTARIDALQKQLDDLKAILLYGQSNNSPPDNISTTLNDALLEQNKPNPYTDNTTIGYTLPQKFTSALIRITDKNGKTLKTVNVSGSGKGTLNVAGATISAGAYNYSLYANGKLVSTKQMQRIK